MAVLDNTLISALTFYGKAASTALEADIFSFVGEIDFGYLRQFRTEIENLAGEGKAEVLAFFINTPGGVVEAVEQMVEIIRHHYKEVWFVVPDMAMSAGTILCMSGDKIFMDYSSALGPIDPQVQNNEGRLVPALGYLDQVERYIEKSRDGTLTPAEFALLQNQDIATLRRFEQARELSVTLLKDWLVKYKFKDWDAHKSTGQSVSLEEKTERAKQIAEKLSDHKIWHSHSRMIGIRTLENELKLKIDDYSTNLKLSDAIRTYSDLILDMSKNRPVFFHAISLSS